MAERRSSFGPVVLLGLGSAALAAAASARPWLGGGATADDANIVALDSGATYPLASAVSLVLLASWGVLLVTRGRVRRAFAVLAAASAVGLLACVIVARQTLPDDAADTLARTLSASRGGTGDMGWSAWFWVAAVASVLAIAAGVLAVRLVPGWPEMGRRYDAPTAPSEETQAPDTDRELWRALDEGRDPTQQPTQQPTREPGRES